MAYLTCTKHRSYQRKHIDVCRKCADNNDCKTYLEHCDQEPPPAPEMCQPQPVRSDPSPAPIDNLLDELMAIRSLVANRSEGKPSPAKNPRPRILDSGKLISLLKAELENIRKLC